MISYYKREKKYIISKKLSSIFDKMELNFISNSKNLSNDEIRFIKVYKHISVNPEFLDVHLLLITKFQSNAKKFKTNKEWFHRMFNEQDDEFKALVKSFDSQAEKLIRLSYYSSSFLFFVLKIFLAFLFVKGQFNIVLFYNRLKNDFKFVQINENILIHQQVHRQVAC